MVGAHAGTSHNSIRLREAQWAVMGRCAEEYRWALNARLGMHASAMVFLGRCIKF